MNTLTIYNNAIGVLRKAYNGSERELFNMFEDTGRYYYLNEEYVMLLALFDDVLDYADFTEDDKVIFLVRNGIAECRNILQIKM